MSSATEKIFEQNGAVERRFYPRSAPSALIYVTFGQTDQALLLNVSENGVLVSTPQDLDCNFVARLSMNLSGLPRVIQVNARVLWTSESQKRAGIQFIDLSEHDREQIRKWQALEATREPRESANEQSKASAEAHSEAGEVEKPAEWTAPGSDSSAAHDDNDRVRHDQYPWEAAYSHWDGRPSEVQTAPAFRIRQAVRKRPSKASESALAASLWVAVPIVIALGIILLIRSGTLPNPLAPAADRNDTASATVTGTPAPDLKTPNTSITVPRTTNGSGKNRLSLSRRNTESERMSSDLSDVSNDASDRASETASTAGLNSAATGRAQSSMALSQDLKHSDGLDSP